MLLGFELKSVDVYAQAVPESPFIPAYTNPCLHAVTFACQQGLPQYEADSYLLLPGDSLRMNVAITHAMQNVAA